MPDGTDYSVIWRPTEGPQTALVRCPVFEVFYGGARGGGKTDGVLGDFLQHAQQHGENAAGLMVRRTLKQLRRTIARSKRIYRPLGAVFNETDKEWTFPNGAVLIFAYLERDDDADNYQGHDYTRVYVEEIGNFPSPAPIMKLMATLRSGAGVPCGFRATGNPGGPGHQWVKARYIDPAPGGWSIITSTFENPFNGEKVTRERVYIPSRLSDNPYLGSEYVANLHMSGSPQLVKAWLEGDWNVVAGAYFAEFGPQHIIKPFQIPPSWPRFRSGDWGSAKPFSFGWWAVADGSNHFPRGALIRYREYYGVNVKPTGEIEPNVGLKLPANEVGARIAELDGDDKINNAASVLDPSAFSSDGGPSIAERIYLGSNKRVMFRRADNKRVRGDGPIGGWDQVRARLIGEEGRPMVYMFETCTHLIRTLPALQHDEIHPEDVDTEGEDHAPDECRYACMSRPYLPSNVPKPDPTFPGLSIGGVKSPGTKAPTMDQLWRDHGNGGEQWR
jgi:hypothetical protein